MITLTTNEQIRLMMVALLKMNAGEKLTYKHFSKLARCPMDTSHFKYVLNQARERVLVEHQIVTTVVRGQGIKCCTQHDQVILVKKMMDHVSNKLNRIAAIHGVINSKNLNATDRKQHHVNELALYTSMRVLSKESLHQITQLTSKLNAVKSIDAVLDAIKQSPLGKSKTTTTENHAIIQ